MLQPIMAEDVERYVLERARMKRNIIASRLAIAVAAYRCMGLPREEYVKCVREETHKVKREIAENVDKMIKEGNVKALKTLMEAAEIY
jgi:N-acetylglucosamine kinase-like BadF-type ATPase